MKKTKILITVSENTLNDLDRIARLSNEYIGSTPNRSRAVRIAASGWLSVYDTEMKRTKGK